VRDRVSAGVGPQRFIGRLIIEGHRARFESPSAGVMTFSGPVKVTRSCVAPLGVTRRPLPKRTSGTATRSSRRLRRTPALQSKSTTSTVPTTSKSTLAPAPTRGSTCDG
jgi:hypothetical protein